VLGARALTAERAGRPEEALAILAVLLTPDYEQEIVERHMWMPQLTRLALASEDPETARRAVGACEAEADREHLPRVLATASWCRGLLDGDAALVGRAVEYSRASGRLLEFGLASEDVAYLLAAGGDVDGARAALAGAMSAYTDLGAVWDGLRAAARMRPFGIREGVRGPRRRPQSGWEALTETELRVAELVATGGRTLTSPPSCSCRGGPSTRTFRTSSPNSTPAVAGRSRVWRRAGPNRARNGCRLMTLEKADGGVGREKELAAFEGFLTDLADGRGRCVLIEGEPGIGKSALLADGLAAAYEAGFAVSQGACDELGQRFPLSVLLDTLAVDSRSPDRLRAEAASAGPLVPAQRAGGDDMGGSGGSGGSEGWVVPGGVGGFGGPQGSSPTTVRSPYRPPSRPPAAGACPWSPATR